MQYILFFLCFFFNIYDISAQSGHHTLFLPFNALETDQSGEELIDNMIYEPDSTDPNYWISPENVRIHVVFTPNNNVFSVLVYTDITISQGTYLITFGQDKTEKDRLKISYDQADAYDEWKAFANVFDEKVDILTLRRTFFSTDHDSLLYEDQKVHTYLLNSDGEFSLEKRKKDERRFPLLSFTRIKKDFLLKNYSKEDLTYMVNELYAYRGYYFEDKELRKHFKKKSWYKVKKRDLGGYPKFNHYETLNIQLIQSILEREFGTSD